jgi:hypothetical protein
MLAIKDPLILYWLQTSGILNAIKIDLEDRLKVEITLDILRVKSGGKASALEVISEFNKDIE